MSLHSRNARPPRTRLLIGIALCLAAGSAWGTEPGAPADGTPRGVNPRDLVSKLDVIFKWDDFDQDVSITSWTLKYDRPLGERWGIAVELPYAEVRTPLGFTNGLSETKVKFRRVATSGRISWVAGTELVLPTAEHDELGSGTWQVSPSVGAVYAVSPQVFAFAGVQRFQSVATEAGRLPVRQNQARLLAARVSPQGWWLMGDLKFTRDLVQDTDALDLEVEAGRMMSARTALSVRLGTSGIDSTRRSGLVLNYRRLF
jgi:hypothetical protein